MFDNLFTAGVDLGYGWNKGVYRKKSFKQPSVIGETRDDLFLENFKETDIVFDNSYYFGDMALRHSNIKYSSVKNNKADTWTTEVMLKTILGVLVGDKPINLVTGLPVKFHSTQKEEMVKLIEKVADSPRFSLEKGKLKKEIKLNIKDYKITLQPLGAAMNYLLDDNGKVAKMDIAKKRVLVVDIGYFTLNLLVLDGLEVGKESDTIRIGVNTAYKVLEQSLYNQFGKSPSRHEMDKHVISKTYEGYDIEILVNNAFNLLSQQIMVEIENLNMIFDHVLLSGGSVPFIENYLSINDKIVLNDSQMSVANGYRKMGVKQWGK